MSDKYELFLPEDFLKDEWFRAWVAAKDPEAAEYWTKWMKAHPEKYNDIFQAQALYHALTTSHRTLSEEEIDESINLTIESIGQQSEDKKGRPPFYFQSWFKYVASILLVSGIFAIAVKFKNENVTLSSIDQAVTQPGWHKAENSSLAKKTIELPDGSKVVLDPGATISYEKNLAGKERRTYLTGDAFFEVSRNPERPFLVMTDRLITKVLGTSFWIRSDQKEGSSSVIVRTGKVSVFKRNIDNVAGDVSDQVILTPNQSAVFFEQTNQLVRTVSKEPRFLTTEQNPVFVYEETLITKVFDDLEAAYGVPIRYDHELLGHCQVTATLGEEPFYEKLELICLSIRASFREENGQIFIDSRGCNY